MNFKDLSLIEIIEKIKSWETSREEIWDYFMKRIEKYDSKIKAYNFVNKDWLNTKDWKLAWVPIAIKDIFCEKGIPTTSASKMLEDFKPPYNSTVIEKLLEEWMSSQWKVNMDEFAMGSTTATSALNTTINPWGTNRIPGGSSGGSAAAVAAWLAPAALWTDTGWSIRQPASVCWVVWFKPSYGRNSRFWVNAMASSLDTPWTLTKTVKDAALLYEISNWEDSKENTSIPGKETINPKIWEIKDFSGIKVWVPKEYFEEWLDTWVKEVIQKAIKDMKNSWAEIIEIDLPMTKYAIATYYILMPAEVSTNLSRLDWIRYWHNSDKEYKSTDELFMNNRAEWFWDEVKRRIILGSYVLSAWYYDAYYQKAAKIRTLIIEDFKNAFEKCDVIVGPVSPSVAWELWEKSDDPLKMYLSDAYTIPASLAWLPAISVPAWYAKSEDQKREILPVWIHMITPQFEEQKLFEIANVYENLTKHYKMPEGYED